MTKGERGLTNTSTTELPVYFIADAHLGIESGDVERAKTDDLVELLGSLRSHASHLYLVGDIFDFWFEYPYSTPPRHERTIAALSSLARAGTAVHFIGGNHDYWAGGKLEALTGASVHRNPIEATHFGRRIFVAHGDGLPKGDRGYRLLRSVIRSPIAVAGFSLIPPRVGAAIARWASGLSDVTDERIRRAVPPMLEFLREKLEGEFDAVVVGHVHRQIVREWTDGTGVVVGDWMAGRSVVALDASGFRPLRWIDGELGDATAPTEDC